jgi:aspartyl-tRNA(Asn)/glutamyl-tRNA(Gln) amidotransferase subunit A
LKAFITVDESGAIQQAQQIRQKRKKIIRNRQLYGIPFSIKDLLATKGLRTTCGSKILQDFVPPYDATVVERFKEQGVVILGKTTMDEFRHGFNLRELCLWNPTKPLEKRVCGRWFVRWFRCFRCGVSKLGIPWFGYRWIHKATGLTLRGCRSKTNLRSSSRYGLTAYASSLDQVGPFCRSVEDCALVLQAISGYDNKDSTSVKRDVPDFCSSLVDGLSGVRVGIPREYFSDAIDKQVAKIVHNGIDLLKERGAKIVEISLPHTEYCVAVYYIIAPSEASSNLARYSGAHFGFRAKGSLKSP